MPKLNKPRTRATLDAETARAFLEKHQIDPSDVIKAEHCADGSMSILMRRGDAVWHKGIEFDPDFTSQVALALRSVGVVVSKGGE